MGNVIKCEIPLKMVGKVQSRRLGAEQEEDDDAKPDDAEHDEQEDKVENRFNGSFQLTGIV